MVVLYGCYAICFSVFHEQQRVLCIYIYIFIYYEIIHKVHNKEKMKKEKEK